MKFPTMDEFAQNVAEKALDEIEYNGKTLRQWIEIITTNSEDIISRRAAVDAMDLYCKNTCPIRADRWCPDCQIEELKKIVLGFATDNNVATKDGTNLAEVGTECISRQQAIDALRGYLVGKRCPDDGTLTCRLIENEVINKLPPIQPEPHWIPVDLENNKPPLEEWVFVSSDGYAMQDCIVKRGGKKIWYHGGNIQSDDRYMPLPEPYKGVTE